MKTSFSINQKIFLSFLKRGFLEIGSLIANPLKNINKESVCYLPGLPLALASEIIK